MADRTCRICDGMGMRIVERADGHPLAEPCECRVLKRNAELLRRSHIPERYKSCTLENYRYDYEDAHPSLHRAFIQANGFTRDYMLQPKGQGLLFTGTVGTGKTHLAVGILQELALKQGVRTLFCDQGELLRDVSHSFHRNNSITEMEVLTPILEAELLVLDELGRFKKSEWVSDVVTHVLNVRYNDKLTTIITTNYPNRAPLHAAADAEAEMEETAGSMTSKERAGTSSLRSIDGILDRVDFLSSKKTTSVTPGSPPDRRNRPPVSDREESAAIPSKKGGPPAKKQSRVSTEETLGDRIGERIRSRLAEMCVTIEMTGADYRVGPKKAYFH